MPLTAINIGTILLLILPGFLAYRFAVWRRADATNRSPLWQISEILEYSAYVHLLGALLVFGAHSLLAWWLGLDTHIRVLFQYGPVQFLQDHFAAAITYFILYPMYVILASAIIGAYGLPQVFSSSIANFPRWLSTRQKFLNWIPVPQQAYPQEPVWYHAFNDMTRNYTESLPYVMVTLKSGDVYFGEVTTYALVPDTENQKDFMLRRAIYYRSGNLDKGQQLDSLDGIGAVLLNTANVDSIKVYYH